MCLTCNIVKGNVLPPGGIIYRDDFVVLHHCLDVNVPGYLILSPLRHVVSYSGLTQTEIFHMGRITRVAVRALEEIDGVEKVYTANFGEETTHFHLHIFPRYASMLRQSGDIYTNGKIDGAKLFSFCRRHYKTEPEMISTSDILTVIEHVRSLINGHKEEWSG